MNRIGANFRALRLQRTESQAALAVALDVTQSTISGIERGEALPSIDLLERAAVHFGVAAGSMLDRDYAPPAEVVRE
jgi:transcriptional regulator with XRE-family HTH domain